MIYSFDNFEINDRLREVRLKNEHLNLEPKVYDLILFFIQNANQAISKDELQDAFWPDVEVSETAVTRAIMKARKALNDEKNQKTYIQTIHGHGYKFMADVVHTEQHEPTPADSTKNTFSKLKSPGLLALMVLLSLVAVSAVYLTQLKAKPNHYQLMVLPIDNLIKDESFAWASLGLMALSSKIIQSNSDIWVMPEKEAIKASELLEERWPLKTSDVVEVKEQLEPDYIVASQLSQIDEENFKLSFEVHHPKGVYSDSVLTGSNPTELVQIMSSQVAQLLPGKISRQKLTVISEDAFTNELFSRGMSYQIQGYIDKAKNYFELAIEQDGSLLLPKIELAIIKRRLHKLEESEADLLNLLDNLSQYEHTVLEEIKLYNSLGVTYLNMLNNERSLEVFQLAYDLAKEQEIHQYVSKTANNISIIFRRQQNLEEARKWAVEALATAEEYDLSNKATVVYLIGQIERDSGNIDKAITLFFEAHKGHLKNKNYAHASSVSSALSNLFMKKGMYSEALEEVNAAIALKKELNDVLGLADSKLRAIDIHIAQGDLITARELLDDVVAYTQEHGITTRDNNLIKIDIRLDLINEKFQQVVDKIDTDAAGIKSKTLDLYKIKAQQQLGNNTVIKTWLTEHKHYQTDSNNMMKMYWLDHENYYLEYHGSYESLVASYQSRLSLSRLMGNDALSINLLLKIGFQHLKNSMLSQAEDVLNEIKTYGLNGWKPDLLEAMILRTQGDNESAYSLAEKAKIKAKNAWREKHQIEFEKLTNQEPYILPNLPVFF